MSEEWRDIPGWEGRYQVSDHGRVRSTRTLVDGTVTTRMLKQRPGKKGGHRRVALCRDSDCKDYRVHCLVLETFVGPRPTGYDGCHWDDDPANNHLSNLRWATHRDNMLDRVRNGKHNWARETHCIHGHPFSGPNMRIDTEGSRRCRSCMYGRHAKNRRGEDPIVAADRYYKEKFSGSSD